ncbi:winged helix DNA-binding domain-containing protein [Diaminobutyricibacter sp. McL0618]|uniref:winged helix DNA-binding domain-containing protein n=1 Tax=Leifsonia sp. McL0618 TaxID=3415677 RepID=UPI003CFB48DF
MPTHAKYADLYRFRQAAHALTAPLVSPLAVAERMLAVQAQDFAAACWALGVRAPGATHADVISALERGEIVRSWPMRGTLHFVPARELGWMLRVTTPRMIAGLALRHRQLELEEHDFARARDLVVEALAGGRSLGRPELMELWERNGIRTAGQRGYHLIYYLAQTGVLCWGPPHRTQQSLVLLDEWAPDQRPLDGDEALAEFLLRYLAGHGPATLKDYVWWSKGTMAGAKAGLTLIRDRLTSFDLDGVTYWMTAELADAAPARAPRSRSVHVLPGFDEYLLGYQDRTPVLAPEFADRIVPGANGIFKPLVVSKGRVAGTWRRTANGSRVAVEAEPFVPFTPAEQAGFATGVRAYGRFLGLHGEVA